jgi:WXG100 family type VII secretion target
MPAQRIKGDFDSLPQISKTFTAQERELQRAFQNIKRQVGVLQGGDWSGKGAKAFYAEMDGLVLPSMEQLIRAMEGGSRLSDRVIKILQQAEADITRLFRGEFGGLLAGAALGAALGLAGAGSGASGEGGSAGAGAGSSAGVGAAGAGGSAAEVPVWQQANPLLARDPNSLFTDDYMRGLIGSQFQGAGIELGIVMDGLSQNPTGAQLDGLLIQLSILRGRPVEQLQSEYQKYQEVKAQQEANTATPEDAPPALGGGHPSFNGSNTQMRYGSVVGDAFGIDPAFGAMLNPTGGLVGPGNWAIAGDDTAVGYHGIVHDAAGYLYNYHHSGPGYDYLGREGRDTSSPLSGQREGIAYWRQATGGPSPISAPAEWVMRDVVGKIDAGSAVIHAVGSIF